MDSNHGPIDKRLFLLLCLKNITEQAVCLLSAYPFLHGTSDQVCKAVNKPLMAGIVLRSVPKSQNAVRRLGLFDDSIHFPLILFIKGRQFIQHIHLRPSLLFSFSALCHPFFFLSIHSVGFQKTA